MVTHPTTSIPVDESKFESKNFEVNQEVSLFKYTLMVSFLMLILLPISLF